MDTSRGFTLVEVIVTILLLAILGAVAGYFIRPAIEAFIAVQRRAELSDVADTALRRLGATFASRCRTASGLPHAAPAPALSCC